VIGCNMFSKNQPALILVGLFFALFICACADSGAPISAEPQNLPPNSTPGLNPLEATLTPFLPESPDSVFTLTPYIQPADTLALTPISPATNTPLPPGPDFDQILFFGYAGGGSAGECANFTLRSMPSVIGGTTYPTGPVDFQSYSGVGPGFEYPRHAELCLGGIPKDEIVSIKLTSPDQTVILNSSIIVMDRKFGSNYLVVKWLDYPADWAEHNQNIQMNSFASRQIVDGAETGSILVSLKIWWAGALPGGTWKAEASWPGQSVYGDFHADPRHLPEISLSDPAFNSKLFPSINSFYPYTCRPAQHAQPFSAIVEAFPPNTPVHVLVYQAVQVGMNQQLFIVYQTAILTDDHGMGRVNLPVNFDGGTKYYLLGVADPSAKLAVDAIERTNVFNFTSIANAMDCFIIPPQPVPSCPGAPAQRMTVHQSGYVCTRSEPVRLRVSPSRAADTLVELLPGTQFTVIGGPSCSDNWSWWYVQSDDGATGWISEGGDDVDPYFICPLQ
jgi:hypothetical protein